LCSVAHFSFQSNLPPNFLHPLHYADIDPGEDVTFDEVKDAAFEIRDRLKKSPGLLTVPLLTGGKGIHVIAPIVSAIYCFNYGILNINN
jgi:DNA primase